MLFNLATVDATPATPMGLLSFQHFFSGLHTRPDFPSFILANPGRALLFKHIKCSTQTNNLASLYAVMPYCTQLRSLTLSSTLAPSFLRQVSLNQFPMLRKLGLTDIPSLRTLIGCFESISTQTLQELSLTLGKNYTERNVDQAVIKPVGLPAIRGFSLINNNDSILSTFSLLLEYLHPILQQLHRLVAYTVHLHCTDIEILVENNEETLRYLDTSEILYTFDLLPSLLGHRVIEELILALPVSPISLGRHLLKLGNMFLKMKLEELSLRRLSFVVPSTYGLLDLGQHSDVWARLAQVLSQAPYLEMVTLLLEPPSWNQSSSMHVTTIDMEVHPSLSVLRDMGRFDVHYWTPPGHKPSVILPSDFVASW
ncbi:hypothetical protein EV361DRAFT_948449 [Lentinula raphanica]|uniref:F-box domain-containing protein n=1 Tax=Lentinula raphanica TaxID=153919 RepID=A0AA38P960_9AGAR|nr:hypothetical protein F5880DRAFT_1612030 [Lentinula raphanica]KAJ3838627.1 hypothetical protein F5878DRAFT_661018 [Lentinula raphanica]KAJ3972825.1 hypothetical protein EV361DRAFT_948449 [Lentinula raphanica]